MAETLHICVDSNEASGRRDIVNHLRLYGLDVEIRKLDICDYVVSDRCGVERVLCRWDRCGVERVLCR